MHQAILDNTDMIKCEVEIIGDPYYLVTGGIGNYRPVLLDGGITTDGEAPYQTHDVVVVLEFKTRQILINPQAKLQNLMKVRFRLVVVLG